MRQTKDTYTGKPFRYNEIVSVPVNGQEFVTVGRVTPRVLTHLHPERLTPAMFRQLNPGVERPWKRLWINGKPVDAEGFMYDGCHKVFLIATDADVEHMRGHGWSEDDIQPLSELPGVWAETCFLRFISGTGASDYHNYVEQGEDAKVVWE